MNSTMIIGLWQEVFGRNTGRCG